MGHYDECRDGYCGICGQTEGNCIHTKVKKQLLDYCKVSDERNNLLIENQKLKEENNRLIKELSQLAIESVTRDKILAKLECEVEYLKKKFGDDNEIIF